MKTKDKSRKWMWWFLGVVVAMQAYFVRELLAAFALFALGFGVVAFVIAALYMLHQGWSVAVQRVATSENPVVVYAKRRMKSVEAYAGRGAVATVAGAEELAKRAMRRPGSAAAR
jgi:Na+-transporting methylmalonyl-CoA/oxaloacetate decarboxylase gamma subunit